MTTQETETSAPPALFDHCVNTYKAMLDSAKSVTTGDDGEDVELSDDRLPNSIIVYEGFLTHLVTVELRLSVPYYTSIRKKLMEMGCIRQLKRGGGNSPSQWELIFEPTLEAFTKATPKKTPTQDKDAMLRDQVAQLAQRVSSLEDTQKAMLEAWSEQFGSEQREVS